MGLNRYYLSAMEGGTVEIIGPELHHMIRVLRQKPGDLVEIFDGRGTLVRAVINQIGNKRAELSVVERLTAGEVGVGPKVIMACAIAKSDRFDWMISKTAELGVDRICPVIFDRTVKQAANPRVCERWLELAISAAKQCKRLYLPVIDEPRTLAGVLNEFKGDNAPQLFYGGFDPDSRVIQEIVPLQRDTVMVVGPEGGLTAAEVEALKMAGARGVKLTGTVLRIETAAIAFAAILSVFRAGSDAGG